MTKPEVFYRIDFGWGAPDLPNQLREQGVELGDNEEWATRVFEAIRVCFSNRMITRTEMHRVTTRFQRRLESRLGSR